MIASLVSSRSVPVPFVVWLIPFFFVGLWLLVTLIISRVSGWTRLAESYRFDQPFTGTMFRWQSVSLGRTGYNNSLQLGVNDQGLYMAPMALFRMFHPPLFLPWSEVSVQRIRLLKILEFVEMRFQRAPEISMKLSDTVAARIASASQGSLRIPSAVAAGI
jgi:hypothetical protein